MTPSDQELQIIMFLRSLKKGEKIEISLDRADEKKLWWRRTTVDEGKLDLELTIKK